MHGENLKLQKNVRKLNVTG